MRGFLKLAVSAFAITAAATSLAAAEPVKIALPVASLESLPIYVAQEKGYFDKHGVEVDIITSRGGGEAMKAYLAGEVDIVGTGFPEVGLMRGRGVDVELFFAQTSRVPFALLARKDVGITSVEQLKGKVVAVTSPGSLTANLTRYFVKQAGLDPAKDIDLVAVGGGGEILGALKSKRADAAMLFEPFVTIAQQEGIADILVDVPAKLDAFSSSPLSTGSKFLEGRPDDAKGVVAALTDALNFIHSDKAGALEIARQKFANADPKVLDAAFARLETYYSKDGKFPKEHVQNTQDISVELGIMPKEFPYDEVVAPMSREGAN
ncbi:ABC transporter substrate-binding protein [Amorphus sp. MBR-141]